MKDNKELFQNLLTKKLKKEFPFIESVEVIRVREHFFELQFDINIVVDFDFIEDNVDKNCYNNLLDDDMLFFSLFSFNYCSKIKIDEKQMIKDITTLYKLVVSTESKIYTTNSSISVISYI